MSAATIITSVVTGGTNNHATVSSEGNTYATDFISQGVLGSISNSGGVGPGTGSFGVRQDSSPDMGITISGTGNTTNTQSIAYIKCTPTSQDLQVLRARMSTDYTGYTINANATGSTVYDWIYLQASATNANTPDSAADNVVALYTSRSTSNTSDNGSPPTYGILLAVVTVANGASSIVNANIADKRTQVLFNTGGVSSTTGWQSLGNAFTYSANNGFKEFQVTTPSDLTGTLSPGMKMQFTRSVTPPTQSASFASASSQYATKASPSGIAFTTAITCEAWVYPLSYTGQNMYVISRADTTPQNGFGLIIDTNGALNFFYAASNVFTEFASVQTIPLNTWTHVAVTATFATKSLAFYINSVAVDQVQTSNSATSITQTGNLSVGALSTGTANTFFNGYISEARVWSVAQSQTNIRNNMAINLVGTETNLQALYQFNGAWTDATTNANTLTANGGASNTQASNPYNAVEYANLRAISYSAPNSTLTLATGDVGTIPNQTLNTPEYSVGKEPFGFPESLNGQVLAYWLFGKNVTNTATATGTRMNGALITLTMPTAGKKLIMKAYSAGLKPGAGTAVIDAYWGSGPTQIGRVQAETATNGTTANLVTAPFTATSGSQNFQLDLWETSAGTVTFSAGTSLLGWFSVEEA